MFELVSIFDAPPPGEPRKRRKRLNPHKLVGLIVLYSFAVDDAVRVLNWLIRSLIHELKQ